METERTYADIEGELELLTTSEQEMEAHKRILSRRKTAVCCQPKSELEKHQFTPKDDLVQH